MDSGGKVDDRLYEQQRDGVRLAEEAVGDALSDLVAERFRVLIFIPTTNELQRFVLSGAFDKLGAEYELVYVFPTSAAAAMRAALADVVPEQRIIELDIPQERYRLWSELFSAACFRYAELSSSFALRATPLFRRVDPKLVRLLPDRLIQSSAGILARVADVPVVRQSTAKRLRQAEKKLRAETKNLKFMKPSYYQGFVDGVLSGMSPMRDIVNIIEEVGPLFAVMPTSLLDIFCNDVLWACQTANFPCVVLQSGWDNLSSKGIIHFKPAYLGAWGPQSQRHGMTIQGVSKNRCFQVGAPHYEFLKPASEDWQAAFRASLGLQPGQKLLMFGGAFRQFDETGVVQRLDEAIEAGQLGNVKVLYRPHPWRSDRQSEQSFFDLQWRHVVFDPDMEERYVRSKEEVGFLKRNVPMFSMEYLGKVLSSVDAVISPMSTLLIEAMLMKKPTMAVAFGDGKHAYNPSVTSRMTHFQELAKSSAVVWCTDSNKFISQCKSLLDMAGREDFAERYRPVLDDIVETRTGSYAERLYKACQKKVVPAARHLRRKRMMKSRKSISHAYSAHLTLKEYCGISGWDPLVPGYWMHGWMPAYHNIHPAFIALHKKEGQGSDYNYLKQIEYEKVHVEQWVSRRDQVDFLITNGYRKVNAIGLPIAYVPEPEVQRRPGTLLVMPPHSHRTHGPDDPLAESYAQVIADMQADFEDVWVCLHEDDHNRGQWVHSFRKRGVKVFVGSDQADASTHHRLKRILSTFEYVTTNGFGSHIAYAAFCGAKVSVYGPYAEFPASRMATAHSIKMFPDLLDLAVERYSERALRTHYPFLFTEPKNARCQLDWGCHEIGADNILSPQEIRSLFGWDAVRAAVEA